MQRWTMDMCLLSIVAFYCSVITAYFNYLSQKNKYTVHQKHNIFIPSFERYFFNRFK